jgi:hypothetical protein
MTRTINIEHKDGRQFATTPAFFHKEYERRAFKATTYEGTGERYVAPGLTKAERERAADPKKAEKAGE